MNLIVAETDQKLLTKVMQTKLEARDLFYKHFTSVIWRNKLERFTIKHLDSSQPVELVKRGAPLYYLCFLRCLQTLG
jgi:hypothetical protein